MKYIILLLFSFTVHAEQKWYLVPDSVTGEPVKVGAQGFVPANAIAEIPADLQAEDDKTLVVVTEVDDSGRTQKRVILDGKKKEQVQEAKRLEKEARDAEEAASKDKVSKLISDCGKQTDFLKDLCEHVLGIKSKTLKIKNK